ncbi:FxsA family protein [Nocardioides donggukensis]|uniref:FxsA family protein n=1 Tax=Nocardioides donggukensis TaxID=2774019 RepID=A0A927PZ49_9ACTN|nr:FxsA family protein [Nocardioides donggukensis]MBD8869548.1 FxsA family protein [Nocardioides donggukensis]
MSTGSTGTGRVRRIPGWLFALLFFGVPLLEIVALIQVGQVIGPGWTILLLVADSILGAWLIKREGGRAFRALTEALSSGRMPARELADGILILSGGILMLTPGFLTDLLGILLILPVTRPVARGLLTRVVAARLLAPPPGGMSGRTGPDARRPRPGPEGHVVEGEVVDDSEDDEGTT